MRATLLTLLIAPLTMGCAREKPLAPTEMTDIVRYMFEKFEDEEALAAAVINLDPWLRSNATSEEAIEGYRLDPLESGDVSSVSPPPGSSLADLLGAAGGNDSSYDLKAQAGHIVETDQSWANSKYDTYARTFLEGTPNAFIKGNGVLRTSNVVQTTSFGVTIPYVLLKDYVWVETDEGISAIVARSWIEEEGCSDNGKNCLKQSFSIDHFHDNGSQRLLRLTATWSQVDAIVALGDDILTKGLADGLQDTFDSTEAHLNGE